MVLSLSNSMSAGHKRILAGFVLGFFLIGFGGLLSLRSISQMNGDIQRIAHTIEVLKHSQDVHHLLSEIVAGSRGYLLTEDTIQLTRMTTAKEALLGGLEDVRKLIVDNKQQELWQVIESAILERADFSEKLVDLYDNESPAAAVAMFKEGHGTELYAEISRQMQVFQEAEERLRTEQHAELNTHLQRAFAVTTGTAFCGMLLVGLSGWRIIHENIKRRTAEAQLRQSAEDLEKAMMVNHRIMKHSLDVICTIDGEGRFVSVSEASEHVWGYPPEELVGRPFMDFVYSEDQAKTEKMAEGIMEGKEIRDFDNRYVHKEGDIIPMRWSSTWSASNNLYFCVARDIREQKRRQAETERLTAILDATPDYVGMATPDGRQVYMNKAGRKMLGLSEDHCLSEGLIYNHYPPDIAKRILDEGIPTAIKEGYWHGETRMSVKGGQEIPVSQIILAHKNEKGDVEFLSTVARDITPQKQAEETLIHGKMAAENANRAKSQFLANMSHELRTPLNAIIGFSEILADQTFGELNQKQTRYVSNILTSGRHLLNLINDILDLAKVEAGKLVLQHEEFAADHAIEGVFQIVKGIAQQKGICLIRESEPGLPHLYADSSKFKQVLYNLLSNAVKFTPENGQIKVKVESRGPSLRVTVTDTGVGIKLEDQSRVWNEFEQVESSYVRAQKGTGLGLALSRKLVELHGGRIWLESSGVEGEGCSFIFELPLKINPIEETDVAGLDSTPKTHLSSATQDASKDSRDSRPLVLVIEDDLNAFELLANYLEQGGYKVFHARTAAQGIEMASQEQPLAITLDVLLPDRPGWEVLHELKSNERTRDIPVVIISITDDTQLGFSLGAAGFLVKPIHRETLIELIQGTSALHGSKIQSVLVIDDDPVAIETVSAAIGPLGYEVRKALSGREGIECAMESKPDLLILDLLMPEMNGFEVVEKIRSIEGLFDLPILIYTCKDLTIEETERLNTTVQGVFFKPIHERLLTEMAKLTNRSQKDVQG